MVVNIYEFLNKKLYKSQNVSDVSSYFSPSKSDSSSNLFSEEISSQEVDQNISFSGGFIESKGFNSGTQGWRINADGSVEFNNAVIRGTLEAGSTIDTQVLDTLIASHTIIAGRVVCILADGTVAHASGLPQLINRMYGIALNGGSAGSEIQILKSGPYTTTGLTPGSFYRPYSYLSSSGYESAVSTVTQSTSGSSIDAYNGVGQTITTSQLFTSSYTFYLSTPTIGTYTLRMSLFQLFKSEGGVYDPQPVRTVDSITRSGSTATLTFASNQENYVTAGDYVTISGATQSEYNGTFKVLSVPVLGGNTQITFPVTGTPATPATGTITASMRYKITTVNWSVTFSTANTETALTFPYSSVSNYITTYGYPFHEKGEKIFVDLQASASGQINVHYSNSSVYADGDAYISGVKDTNKDLRFVLNERWATGTLQEITPSNFVGGTSSHVLPTHPYSLTSDAIGLARSSTKLLVGNFSRN